MTDQLVDILYQIMVADQATSGGDSNICYLDKVLVHISLRIVAKSHLLFYCLTFSQASALSCSVTIIIGLAHSVTHTFALVYH